MPTSYFSPRRTPKPHMLHNYTTAGAQHITPGLQCVVQMSHRLFLALFAICSVAVFFCFIYFKHVKNPCSHLFGHSCGFTFMNYISYKIQTAHYIYFTMISFQMKQGFPSCYKITATILFFQ